MTILAATPAAIGPTRPSKSWDLNRRNSDRGDVSSAQLFNSGLSSLGRCGARKDGRRIYFAKTIEHGMWRIWLSGQFDPQPLR